jgi:polysaccharide deacetylase family protein (PEP-CTERM system associated)
VILVGQASRLPDRVGQASRLPFDDNPMPVTPIINALTVDVEDYYQVSAFERVVARDRWHDYESRVAANTDRLLALFGEANVRATFFVLGWAAEREPAIVRRIADAGHEVASHGYGHRLVYDQSPEAFREDVRRAKEVLQAAAGRPVLGYRAPSFSVTDRSLWALDVLIEEGFAYDASIFPIRHDRYGIPSAPRAPFWVEYGRAARCTSLDPRGAGLRAGDVAGQAPSGFGGAGFQPACGAGLGTGGRLLEIPATTVRLLGANLPVGGGGYFRLLPYWWTRRGIRRVNEREGRAAVFYVHPWEVDPAQPRLAASRLSRFRHYRNLEKTETRLRRLLSDFRFGPIAEAILAKVPVAA